MPTLDSSTFIAILNKPDEPTKIAAEFTYTESKKISVRLQTRDETEEFDVDS